MTRTSLSWSKCDVCRRTLPVFRCRIKGLRVNICLICAYTLSADCDEVEVRIGARRAELSKRSISPDERLIRTLKK
ncbi:MAG: hypothetical protein F7B95_04450 [Desulfurococcales archaeon]|nr:hypothetical protein [Desulfurococcales archaeon]